jgi:hypothetical protein
VHPPGRVLRAHNILKEGMRSSSMMPLIFLALCVVIGGCNYPKDYLKFSKLPPDQQKSQFKGLPLDKQIDYYLYDQAHEPPRMGFDDDIASQGRAALPVLLKRLKAEPEDYRRYDLIRVIEIMHSEYVALNEDKQTIDTVEEVIGRMKDPAWRDSSRKVLQVIHAKPGTPAPRPRVFPGPNG